MIEAVRKLLLAETDITARVGSRVYLNNRQQFAQLPAILIEKLSVRPNESKERSSGLDVIRIAVSVFATDYVDAAYLSRKIRETIDNYAGNVSIDTNEAGNDIGFADYTISIGRISYDTERDDWAEQNDGLQIITQEYLCYEQREGAYAGSPPQMPSVSGIVFEADVEDFPATGQADVLYGDTSSGTLYYWNGSDYSEWNGSPGSGGTTWRVGTGAPSNSLGVNGDLYLQSNGDVHEKISGSYQVVMNLRGPQGIQGPAGPTGATGSQGPAGNNGQNGIDGKTIRNGSGAPSSGLGVDGDFYIDTTADDIYGPKTSGSWGSPTSLIGPQGPTGATGPAGPTGAAGANGSNGTNGANADVTRSSTSSISIGTGSRTLTYTSSSNLGWVIGTRLRFSNSSTNWMEGAVTSVSSTSVTINVTLTSGSGSFSSWNISIAGEPGSSVTTVPSLFSNNTTITHTGTTTETKLYSQLIPAGTLTAGDLLDIMTFISATSNANNKTFRMYLNTSDSLTGATQIAFLQVTTTGLNGVFQRFLQVISSTSQRIVLTSSNVFTGYGNSSANYSNLTIDFTVDQYLMISGQLANTGDTMIIYQLKARNNR